MSLLHIRPLPNLCSIFSLGSYKELTLSYVILGITAYVFYGCLCVNYEVPLSGCLKLVIHCTG